MCRRFDTIPACDRQTDGRTDGQTDGIAVASTALAMRALRCAVKTVEHRRSDSRSLLVAITSRLVDVLAIISNTAFLNFYIY